MVDAVSCVHLCLYDLLYVRVGRRVCGRVEGGRVCGKVEGGWVCGEEGVWEGRGWVGVWEGGCVGE